MKRRRYLTKYCKKTNVKHWLLNILHNGNKDECIKFLCNYVSLEIYDNEFGYIYMDGNCKFDLNGWEGDKKFEEKLKHSKAYFRKPREKN